MLLLPEHPHVRKVSSLVIDLLREVLINFINNGGLPVNDLKQSLLIPADINMTRGNKLISPVALSGPILSNLKVKLKSYLDLLIPLKPSLFT